MILGVITKQHQTNFKIKELKFLKTKQIFHNTSGTNERQNGEHYM